MTVDARLTLRDGSTTGDRRLDAIPEHDPKSLGSYPVAELLAAAAPRRGRSWVAGPVLDQGEEGACVGFAFGGDLAADPVRAGGTASDLDELARRVYRRAQQLDPWPDDIPYEGTSILAGAKACREAGHFAEYRWAANVDELVAVLTTTSTSGSVTFGPVVAGVDWHDGMYETDGDGLVSVDGPRVGVHAILVRGVLFAHQWRRRRDEPLFRWRNSWGTGYGINGDGLIFAGDLERILGAQPELCVPVYRTKEG